MFHSVFKPQNVRNIELLSPEIPLQATLPSFIGPYDCRGCGFGLRFVVSLFLGLSRTQAGPGFGQGAKGGHTSSGQVLLRQEINGREDSEGKVQNFLPVTIKSRNG